MLPFVFLITIPILITMFGKSKEICKKSDKALLVFFTMLTLLVILRHESIGNDTHNYIYFFKEISTSKWNWDLQNNLEIGFVFFNKLISYISKEPRFYLCFSGILISIIIYKIYKRLNTDTALTIVLFCNLSIFFMLFSGIRQMLAICVGLLAYECTRKRKVLLYLFLVVIAITIHTSAFMLFFMYPLYYMKIKKKSLWYIIPIFAIILLFNKPVFSFLGEILSRYTKYEATITSTGAYTMIILLSMFSIYSYVIPNNDEIDEETAGLRNFLLFSLLIQFFSPLNNIAMRMNYYYIIFIPLLIPKIIDNCTPQNKIIAMCSRYVMILFFFINYFRMTSGDITLHTVPYHFFWESFI